MMRRMGIFLSVTVSMMHSMHHRICFRAQVRRTLSGISHNVEEFLPKLVHGEHAMGCISVQEKGLAEQRHVPVAEEECKNYVHGIIG